MKNISVYIWFPFSHLFKLTHIESTSFLVLPSHIILNIKYDLTLCNYVVFCLILNPSQSTTNLEHNGSRIVIIKYYYVIDKNLFLETIIYGILISDSTMGVNCYLIGSVIHTNSRIVWQQVKSSQSVSNKVT